MHGKECKAEYRILLAKRYPANIIKKNIELSILFAYTESLNLLQMGILIGCTNTVESIYTLSALSTGCKTESEIVQ